MSKVLRSTHAVDVGGMVVEPGDPIPDDADPDVVKQLEDDELVVDESSTDVVDETKTKRSSKGGE